MIQIVIRGYAAVSDGERDVTDPAVLRTFAGLVYDDETFTEFLAPSGYRLRPEEPVLAATLEPGGVIAFSYNEGDPLLTATTEYRSPRPLTPAELRALVDYTMGQWSDGIGENLNQTWTHDEYSFLCLWSAEVVREGFPAFRVASEYPTVEVSGSAEAVQAWHQFESDRHVPEGERGA